MAIDIIARGLAASLIGSDGKIDSAKMPVLSGVSDLQGFTPVGSLTDPSQLEGKTAEEILLMMLFGIVNPTLTDPKLSIVLSKEMEQHIIGRPSLLKGSLTFSRGSISPAYGTSGYRSGAPTWYVLNDEVIETSSTQYDFEIPFTPIEKETSFSYSVTYEAGEQPLNSAGSPFDAPLPAGSIYEDLIVNAAYPLYAANGEDHPFVWFEDDDGAGYLAEFGTEVNGIRQAFAVSSEATVVGVKAFNILTQQWEWIGSQTAAVSLTYFDTTILSGDSINEPNDYILYTYNSTPVGTRELRVYVK